MRAIKFRAWYNGDGKKGMYFPSTYSYNEVFGVKQMQWLFPCDDGCHKYIVTPLMQFTGLTDKNDKEIYEGDIVTYKRSIGNWTGQYMTTTHKIVFSEEVFAFVMEYGSSYIKLRKHWGYEYEVIGNIYENPEILTKE
jgi:uncharacterized phage protein (TIGR01671 family)